MNIDRIAREMVDIEPSRDLESRIRARLREARPASSAAWWTWRVAAPVGALAAIAFALVVQSPESQVQSPDTVVAVPRSAGLPGVAAPAGAVAQASSQVAEVRTSQLPRITSRLPKVPASQLSSEEIAWMARRIPALDPMNSLEVDHLRVDSIQPEPLAITPLTMTPVATDGGGIERRNDR